jgi:hypothetical protein
LGSYLIEEVFMRGRLAYGILFAAVFYTPWASADIAPPRDYVEKCSIEAQQKSGEQCRLCGGSFRGREECKQLASQGYRERCRTYGASVWQEVWCRLAPKSDKKASLDEMLPQTVVAGSSFTLALIFGGIWAARKIKRKNSRSPRFDVKGQKNRE